MRIGLEIKKLNNLIGKEICRRTAIYDGDDKLTNMHGRIIGFIRRKGADGHDVFQRDIENEFMISGPSVSEILKLMEKNALIERRSVAYDGRLKKIVLTDKALELQHRVEQILDCFESELEDVLTDEESRIFETIIVKLKAELQNKNKKETV